MTCARCDTDDCPTDAWHLHVTVAPHKSWNRVDFTRALVHDAQKHSFRPVVVTNVIPAQPAHGRPERFYRELIPTRHVRGTEAEATREIFQMGVLLNNAGWRVRRLKIEGSASRVPAGRALYYETHLKNLNPLPKFVPMSTNQRGDMIHTLRKHTMDDMEIALDSVFVDFIGNLDQRPTKIEACVLDTAPELDDEWMGRLS